LPTDIEIHSRKIGEFSPKIKGEGTETEAQAALDGFATLEPILEEALDFASHPDGLLARTINLREFLRSMGD